MKENITTISKVHMEILQIAANIANREYNMVDVGEQLDLGFESGGSPKETVATGQIFRADPIRSTKGGLCLSVDEMFVKDKSKEEIEEIHNIGIRAIKEAIVTYKPSLFVGLILGEARKGNNYFDRFGVEPQTRLF